MKLESTTYHYKVEAPDPGEANAWPHVAKRFSKTITYAPDSLMFDVHVTHEKHHVTVQNVRLSGQRVLKDGLSPHRVRESMFTSGAVPA